MKTFRIHVNCIHDEDDVQRAEAAFCGMKNYLVEPRVKKQKIQG